MNDGAGETPDFSPVEGRYFNCCTIGHNAFEFLFDFGQFYPGGESAKIHTRLITTPIYAKILLETLRESVDRYERTFGVVPSSG